MKPILIDLPLPITTPRLILRPPAMGEGKIINAAILESFADLYPWMPWAQVKPSVFESEEFARQAAAKWLLREELVLWMFDRATGDFVGGTGFHTINWDVPRLEIGYWIRSSAAKQGLMTEAISALTKYAFETIGAKRVEIRCDRENLRSRLIPERLGYRLDAIFEKNEIKPNGQVRDTAIYARLSADGLS